MNYSGWNQNQARDCTGNCANATKQREREVTFFCDWCKINAVTRASEVCNPCERKREQEQREKEREEQARQQRERDEEQRKAMEEAARKAVENYVGRRF